MIWSTKGALEVGLFFLAFGFLIGAGIGLAVTALVRRERLTARAAFLAAVLSGTVFVLGTLLSGWADSRSPASWLRTNLAQHGLAITVIGCCATGLLVGLSGERRRTNDERPT